MMINQNNHTMPNLNWLPDTELYELAQQYPLVELSEAKQYQGGEIHTDKYRRLADENCLNLNSSPVSIIKCAQHGQWLCFLLKVGLWGNMIPGPLSRPMTNIYGQSNPRYVSGDRLRSISMALSVTYQQLINEVDFKTIWHEFDKLNWSHVIRSKCLHFQARAANIEGVIPIAIDGLMSNQWLWKGFKNKVLSSDSNMWPRPAGITDKSFESYNRYFSAMNAWAAHLNINVDDLEIRLFQAFREGRDINDLFV